MHFTHLFLSNLSINSKAIRFIEFSLIKKIMNWKIVNIIRHADWSYIFRIIHWDVNKILIRRTRRRKYISPWNTEYTHILNFLLIKELSNNLYLHDKLDKQYSDVILLIYIVRFFLFLFATHIGIFTDVYKVNKRVRLITIERIIGIHLKNRTFLDNLWKWLRISKD